MRTIRWGIALTAVAVLLWAVTPAVYAASFTECPPVGNDTNGCELLLTVTSVNSSDVATGFNVTTASPDQGPFDGIEDTLIGVLNSSGGTLKSVAITGGVGSGVFGFDGDGACIGTYSPSPTAAQCGGSFTSTDPNDYESASATFANISPSLDSGTVLVGGSSGLANTGTAWFDLEGQISAGQIAPNPVPEPSSLSMFAFGLVGAAGLLRRKVRR